MRQDQDPSPSPDAFLSDLGEHDSFPAPRWQYQKGPIHGLPLSEDRVSRLALVRPQFYPRHGLKLPRREGGSHFLGVELLDLIDGPILPILLILANSQFQPPSRSRDQGPVHAELFPFLFLAD